uniref:TGS domain-containing protein n=1 Tax=Meloidogyne enterolobii TaxID=390850 RepID=A0A6V7V3J3_MELEN|nr:unnamed protein product [Meloidogyne enterolobii]
MLKRIWEYLALIRIYTKKPGSPPDLGPEDGIILRGSSTVEHACHALHRTLAQAFRYAIVWELLLNFLRKELEYNINCTMKMLYKLLKRIKVYFFINILGLLATEMSAKNLRTKFADAFCGLFLLATCYLPCPSVRLIQI